MVSVLATLIIFAGSRGMNSYLPIIACAWQLEASKPRSSESESNLVRVPVSVTDASGNPVIDLEPGDFADQGRWTADGAHRYCKTGNHTIGVGAGHGHFGQRAIAVLNLKWNRLLDF